MFIKLVLLQYLILFLFNFKIEVTFNDYSLSIRKMEFFNLNWASLIERQSVLFV